MTTPEVVQERLFVITPRICRVRLEGLGNGLLTVVLVSTVPFLSVITPPVVSMATGNGFVAALGEVDAQVTPPSKEKSSEQLTRNAASVQAVRSSSVRIETRPVAMERGPNGWVPAGIVVRGIRVCVLMLSTSPLPYGVTHRCFLKFQWPPRARHRQRRGLSVQAEGLD